MEPLITVIIPVYNCQNYIMQCVKSLKADDLIEVILVNDGSTDDSLLECNKLVLELNNVSVYSQNNKGVSSARNLGLSQAQGEYIVFIDADDFVNENYLSSIIKLISDHDDVDLFLFDYLLFDGKNKTEIHRNFKEGMCVDFESFLWFSIKTNLGCPWDKVFKNSIIKENKLEFNENLVVQEDLDFCINYIMQCQSFYYMKDCIYVYRINNGGAMARCNENYILSYDHIFKRLLDINEIFLYEHSLEKEIYETYLKKISGSMVTLKKQKISRQDRYSMANKYHIYEELIKYNNYKVMVWIRKILLKYKMI